MSPDAIFLVCNYGVMPAWLLLLVAPGWDWTDRIVHRVWIPVFLGLVYAWALFTGPPPPEGAGFGSLAAVTLLFSSPGAVLAGWVHYLVFDLFIGAWQARDARRRGISHLWLAPCLVATLMVGPLGLLLYLTVRFALTRSVSLVEATP